MKFKIISLLVVLGMLSVMPLIYSGKLDPAEFLSRFDMDDVNLDTDDITAGLSKLKDNVPGAGTSQEVTVYKWRGTNGVMQFGSQPPPGAQNVEVMSVNGNKNVVDAVKIPPKQEARATAATEISAPSPYSVKGMKKVLDDAKGVEELLKKSQQDRERMIKNL